MSFITEELHRIESAHRLDFDLVEKATIELNSVLKEKAKNGCRTAYYDFFLNEYNQPTLMKVVSELQASGFNVDFVLQNSREEDFEEIHQRIKIDW